MLWMQFIWFIRISLCSGVSVEKTSLCSSWYQSADLPAHRWCLLAELFWLEWPPRADRSPAAACPLAERAPAFSESNLLTWLPFFALVVSKALALLVPMAALLAERLGYMLPGLLPLGSLILRSAGFGIKCPISIIEFEFEWFLVCSFLDERSVSSLRSL